MAQDSRVETFAALRLEIDSWRWEGVPIYIRAGKCLPVTCTEIVVRWRQPPTMFAGSGLKANYCRMRISPDITIAIGANAIPSGQERGSEVAEMVATHHPGKEEMDAYERLLGDALSGDSHPVRARGLRRRRPGASWTRCLRPRLLPSNTSRAPGDPTSPNVTPPGGWQDPVVGP